MTPPIGDDACSSRLRSRWNSTGSGYDLRHSFVSLLLAERWSLLEVARQAGHSPTVALNTYGHVIEELEGADKVNAEAAIRQARTKFVRTTFARRPQGRERRGKKSLQNGRG